jgi:hypothetical protein
MTRQQYSKKESLNRIVRSWLGIDIPSDVPDTLSGSILSEDEAFSFLAELFEDSLPGETPTIPDAVRASTVEAQAGTNDTKAVTPLGVAAAIGALAGASVEYGGIYNNSTGTAVVTLSTSWEKITGSYQGVMESSDDITPEISNCRIIVNHIGILFCGIQASFSGGNNASIEGAVHVDGVRQESIRFRRKLGTGGDVGSASASGIINVTGTPVDVEFFARADAGTPNFKLESGQIWVYGLPTS